MPRLLDDDHQHANPDAAMFENGCRGKQGMTSKRQANGRVRVLIKRGLERYGYRLNAYKCKSCGYWHVGNSILSRRERAALDKAKAVGAS